jgi:hypothetical protein
MHPIRPSTIMRIENFSGMVEEAAKHYANLLQWPPEIAASYCAPKQLFCAATDHPAITIRSLHELADRPPGSDMTNPLGAVAVTATAYISNFEDRLAGLAYRTYPEYQARTPKFLTDKYSAPLDRSLASLAPRKMLTGTIKALTISAVVPDILPQLSTVPTLNIEDRTLPIKMGRHPAVRVEWDRKRDLCFVVGGEARLGFNPGKVACLIRVLSGDRLYTDPDTDEAIREAVQIRLVRSVIGPSMKQLQGWYEVTQDADAL